MLSIGVEKPKKAIKINKNQRGFILWLYSSEQYIWRKVTMLEPKVVPPHLTMLNKKWLINKF